MCSMTPSAVFTDREPQQDFVQCKSCGRVTGVDPRECRCLSCGQEICLHCGCTPSTRCYAGLDEHPGCTIVRPGLCSACESTIGGKS